MGKTYREWQEEGYNVRKGEKASGRNRLGESTFTASQVDDMDLDESYDDDGSGYEDSFAHGAWEDSTIPF